MLIAKSSYIPWIDTLKGIAIVMVILQHVGWGKTELLQWYSIGQSVPIFLFCSAYLLGRKDIHNYFTSKRLIGLWKRIAVPFLVCTVVTFCLIVLLKNINGGRGVSSLITQTVLNGGCGPGCYYPWMYVQFFFAIPVVKWIIDKCDSLWRSLFVMICISISLELITLWILGLALSNFAQPLWRLLFVRYTMLIWIGICFDRIIQHHSLWIFLALISLMFASIDIWGVLKIK